MRVIYRRLQMNKRANAAGNEAMEDQSNSLTPEEGDAAERPLVRPRRGSIAGPQAEPETSGSREPATKGALERVKARPATHFERSADIQFTAQQPQPRNTEAITVAQVFYALWRNKIILLCLASLGIAAGCILSLRRTPVYRARTAIRLEGLNDTYLNVGDVSPFAPSVNTPPEIYMPNELKSLQSESLATRVASRLGIDPVPHRTSGLESLLSRFNVGRRPPSADDLRIAAIERSLSVRSSLKSQVVEVFFDSTDPVFAANAANTVVSEYIAMNREARAETAQETTGWLVGQIADLKAKVDSGNNELQAFLRSSNLLYGANQSSLTEQRVRAVQSALSEADADRAAKQSEYETAISNSAESLPNKTESVLLREYQAALAPLRRELVQLQTIYTPAHYKVQSLEAQIAQLESAIARERRQNIDRMRTEFESATRLQTAMATTYRDQTRKLQAEAANASHYDRLKHELDSTQRLYDSLVQKLKEAGVASTLHATSVRVIDPARPPVRPYSPDVPLNCAVGLSGGLLLAAGFVTVREIGAYRASRTGDCKMPHIRELGVIPAADRDPGLRRSKLNFLAWLSKDSCVEMATWHQASSSLTESFRAAIVSVLLAPDVVETQHTLTITSVAPKEGKTTILSNLGIALTEAHCRVLLIDADLRQPRLHKIFGQANDTGLTTVLTGDEPISELKLDLLAHSTTVPGLFVLPSGPAAESITNLLYSKRLAEFLARVRTEFDYVLIDTPPTGLFPDARILASLSDSVILVIRAAKTDYEELAEACNNFVADGSKVLGTILNQTDVKVSRGPYSSYGYGRAL